MRTKESLLKRFFTSPESMNRIRLQDNAATTGAVCKFIQSLRSFGIETDQISIEGFELFRHTGLASAIEQFVAEAPGEELPLKSITIVQYARCHTYITDLEATREDLRHASDGMTLFATQYNIEISLHIYIEQISSATALSIADFAAGDAIDQLGFFYLFSDEQDLYSITRLRQELGSLCSHPSLKNPKIRIGNFPFCLLPQEALTLIYRDAVSELRGHIRKQRDLVREIRGQEVDVHAPCTSCRCKAACYAYTEIGEHPESAGFVVPRRSSTLVFAGGSITPKEAGSHADQVWCGPAEQGDIVAAILDGFETILIIDGYFYTKLSCTTLEVMVALEQGISVFGAASIGALRAIELDHCGMVGMGYVYHYLKQQSIKSYHVVAQIYDEYDRPLTTSLIQILYFLECAYHDGIINLAEQQTLNEQANSIYFTQLSFDAFFHHTESSGAFDPGCFVRLRAYHVDDKERFNIQKHDANQLLSTYKEILTNRPADWTVQQMGSYRRRTLTALHAKYAQTDDFTVQLTNTQTTKTLSPVLRDTRTCTATETIRHAESFLKDLNILTADTSGYDPVGNLILSSFFIPFYFLNYYPSSTTGNGDRYDEALASSYMELVERLSACGREIQGRTADSLKTPLFPVEKLPQFYNWGVSPSEKQQAITNHGYVSVSDIVSGETKWIPAFSVMFRYSGTDGFSSGNTLSEAILYGLYEVIERDTCQIHLGDGTCRKNLSRLMINRDEITDPHCRSLLARLSDLNCDVALFLLPNIVDVPCVMCHVYDRKRKIQCPGGISVRANFTSALRATLHEAIMQNVTYFSGTRDDHYNFSSVKQSRIAYRNAQTLFFDHPAPKRELPETIFFSSIQSELDDLKERLTSTGSSEILVADISPYDAYQVKSVKVIVPGYELWFCPDYQPSSYRPARIKQTIEIIQNSIR
ncbi:MAG TPA: YcaO-like family protein [Clostridia bacterium]|nr:YcaO-like family protein [Clostridia bacterium]